MPAVSPHAAATASRIGLRTIALAYLTVLLIAPLALVFYRAFEHGFGTFWDAVTSPAALHALWLTVLITAIAVPLNAIFGVLAALILVRRRVPGALVRQRAHRPAPRAVAGGRRPLHHPGLGPERLVGRLRLGRRHAGHLRPARHGPGHDLRLPALRGARGGAGPARGGHRPGGGGLDPRAPAAARSSGASPSRPSAGASSTASSSPPRARSASTARSRWCPAASRATPRRSPSS